MIDRRSLEAALLALTLCSCAGGGEQATSASVTSAKAASSPGPRASSGGQGGPSSAASASTSAAAGGEPALTKEGFCERVVKLGEARLAKCTKDDMNQRSYLDFKPEVESAKKSCEERVLSAQVEFHASVAAQCLAAAEKREPATSFSSFSAVAECSGVLSGKVAAGQPARFVEECAPGLTLRKGKCEPPAAANAECDNDGRGPLAKEGDHPSCEPGLACRYVGEWADGEAPPRKCIKAVLGERCNLMLGNCPNGSTCYQGVCREPGAVGAECMNDFDCRDGAMCDLPGGLFGKCAPLKALGEKCKAFSSCASGHCRAGKCSAFCAGG